MMNMDFSINVGGRLLSLESPLVMGILNCTPDSFFSGSRKQTEREIAERAQQIVAEGGRMIDVGAFSTRPGADEVPIEEELRRLQTALQIVRREVPDAIVSVDTYRPLVARRCVEEWGADIVNDVSEGGRTGIVGVAIHEEESMFATVAQLGVPYILMSVQPTIETLLKTWADDVLQLRELGQKDIILDPGFGFGKTLDENYAVMGELEKLAVMELPLLVGVSRKSMIWKLLDGTPDTALNGTTALNAIALLKGAKILRVHDVKEAVEVVEIVKRLKG
ncbi:MAG: dihydropteroate synthase [Prevotella sp.]|nr:dihydropteroate synthase [Prevotella sp.]